jgi:phospholipid/cholesterol/gamma-HCH transport system ATP-binding protein
VTTPLIRAEGLVKVFGGRRVLDGLDLEIDRGEARVVIGRSGCGKSVLLRHLVGLVRPDAGRVVVDGVSVGELGQRELSRLRLKFGMLFQGAALFDSLSVAENVGFGLVEHARMKRAEIRSRVGECLELVGLSGTEDKMPQELSGGMRKRVGLARAIALKPEILLCDEPTSGLDPVTADSINQLMIQLKERLRITSVTVTHDMSSAYRIADRISMLDGGRIRFTGTAEAVRANADPVVRRFVQGLSMEP